MYRHTHIALAAECLRIDRRCAFYFHQHHITCPTWIVYVHVYIPIYMYIYVNTNVYMYLQIYTHLHTYCACWRILVLSHVPYEWVISHMNESCPIDDEHSTSMNITRPTWHVPTHILCLLENFSPSNDSLCLTCRIHIYTYIYLYVHAVYIYMHTYIFHYVYVCIYIYTYIYIYIHIRIWIYVYIYIYTYTF